MLRNKSTPFAEYHYTFFMDNFEIRAISDINYPDSNLYRPQRKDPSWKPKISESGRCGLFRK